MAEPFYVRINGNRDVPATNTGVQDYQGRVQYAAMNVTLAAGDLLTCYDAGSGVAWNIGVIDPYGAHMNFTTGKDALKCNVAGTYDIYIKMKMNDDMWYICVSDGDTPAPYIPQNYDTAVPSESEDVMLQGFYWDSQYDKGYGDTRWTSLTAQAAEIGSSFSLVWLPPSAESEGGLGYIPKCYSNQNSSMGSRTELEALLRALHASGVKVIADIVINHCGNNNNWCNFRKVDFGAYGTFEPNSSWITSDDEGGCNPGGNPDDGQHDANYGAARDWDHTLPQVRSMCEAYTQWMKNVMLYDGFRYDYCGGFHTKHIDAYNTASKPYFSVMEFWYGDATTLKTRIDQAGKNTLAFDFALKYNALRDGIFKKSYTKCLNAGLRGKGYSKYAVTFIDNHDTFERSDNQGGEFIKYQADLKNADVKRRIMEANAYILMLPGVPCVFYPHWKSYPDEINALIAIRKEAGIHSESEITESSSPAPGNRFYEATVTGHRGTVILRMGVNRSKEAPEGYEQVLDGGNAGQYTIFLNKSAQGVAEVSGDGLQVKGEKFLEDGKLMIRRGEAIYNITGQKVK